MSHDAELMALGICHRLPFHAVGGDGHTKSSCAKCLEMENVRRRVVGMHVKMHSVLADLRLRDRLQDQNRTGRLILKRGKDSVAVSLVDEPVAEGCFPERDKAVGIKAIKHYRDAHDVTLEPFARTSHPCVECQQVLFCFTSNEYALCSIG